MAGLLDYFNNQSNPNAGAWGGNPMGGDPSGSTAGAGFMGGMQDPRAAYKMQQMLKAASQPVNGRGGGAWASALTNLLQGYMGGQNESGYQDYAQNQEAKSLQMDYLRAQGQERTAQAQALQQKAANDQKRQGIVNDAMQQWNSPNQGLTNGPTTPEYSDVAPKFATQRSNDPRDLYAHVASALERGGDLAGGYQQRLDAQKLSPQVEKYDVQMVNGQPRQVAMMKDGSYKVLDGVSPTANLQFENLGDRTAMIDKYTGAAAGSLARGQSPDSVASNLNSMKIAGMVDARSREGLQQSRDAARQIVIETPNGPMFADKSTGTARPITLNGENIQPNIKPSEGYLKAQSGIENTRNAITGLRGALKNFSVGDSLIPDKRTQLSSIYNNAILQAKEAYNLGVLSGPDEKILQGIITNPLSFTGTLTSKSAMDSQAAEVDRILGNMSDTNAKVHRQPAQRRSTDNAPQSGFKILSVQ